MTRQKSLIGMEIDCNFRTIEASLLSRLYRSFNQPNLFIAPKIQNPPKNETYHYLPSFLLGNLVNLPMIYRTLGLNINNILLSRESVIYHRPIAIGNSVTIKTFLKDAYEQQASSNPIGFIVLESVGYLNEAVSFYCERIIAVRGGFQRGRPK